MSMVNLKSTSGTNGTGAAYATRAPDVVFENARWRLGLWVEEADIEAAAIRGQLYADGEAEVARAAAAKQPLSAARQSLLTYFYPRLISVTPSGLVERLKSRAPEDARDALEPAEIAEAYPWPVPFDVFRILPEPVWDLWEKALVEKNPHLKPPPVPAPAGTVAADAALEEAQKKAIAATAPS